MQSRNRILEDLARVASGALGVAAGMRREVEETLRQRFAAVLADADFVSREEFEAVRDMAAKARSENEELALRLDALERRQGGRTRSRTRAAPKENGGGVGTQDPTPKSDEPES